MPKLLSGDVKNVNACHNAIFNARLFGRVDEIVSDLDFAGSKDGSLRSALNTERQRVNFVKINSFVAKGLPQFFCVELKISESFVGVGVFLQVGCCQRWEESNDCRSVNDDDGLRRGAVVGEHLTAAAKRVQVLKEMSLCIFRMPGKTTTDCVKNTRPSSLFYCLSTA